MRLAFGFALVIGMRTDADRLREEFTVGLVNARTAGACFRMPPMAPLARLRIVNAGSDTAFRVALAGHRLTVTHSDGFPVQPVTTDALLIGMGERYDVTVDLADGVFPLVASAEGKTGAALAMVRTGGGTPTGDSGTLPELSRRVILGSDLTAHPAVRLDDHAVDRRLDVVIAGGMMPFRWTINGATFPHHKPLDVAPGERVRLRLWNRSMMFHPMHLHGHTFGLVDGGARKDTVIVRPMQSVEVDLEAGMMTGLSYRN